MAGSWPSIYLPFIRLWLDDESFGGFSLEEETKSRDRLLNSSPIPDVYQEWFPCLILFDHFQPIVLTHKFLFGPLTINIMLGLRSELRPQLI